jgi:ADP-heptose:LPS heptosyltransferase
MLLHGRRQLPDPQRILVIQLRRIGDVLLSTPAIRALSERFPGAKIDFMAESPADEVLRGNPLIERLLIAPRQGSGESFFKFVRHVRERKYDWTIDFFSNPRSAQFAFLSGAKIRVGLDRRGRRWAFTHRVVDQETERDLYAVDLRLRILEQLGVPAITRQMEIYSDHADLAETARVLDFLHALPADQPVVTVATGSANPAKRYPAHLMAKVIDELRRMHRTVVLTSGPGELEFGDEIQPHLSRPVPHLTQARVPTLTALYRRCQLYVGPDSSPKHIAAACGLPTVTIFGPGNPASWNDPQNPRNIVLVAPCETRPHCDETECARKRHIGMIQPEAVIMAAKRLLAEITE